MELKKTLEKRVEGLTDTIAKRNAKLVIVKDDKEDNEKGKENVEKHEENIKPDCKWALGSFEERMTKRKAEMDGLVTAKDFLAGYQEDGAALVQAHSPKR